MSAQYEAAAREAADKPAVFRLHGEKFSTLVEPDGLVIMDLAKAAADEESRDEDDEMAGTATLAAYVEFLEGVLPSAEFRRFRRVVRRHHVGLETIMTIVKDLVPLLFGFPTAPSSSSAASPSTTGRSSMGGVTSLEPQASTG